MSLVRAEVLQAVADEIEAQRKRSTPEAVDVSHIRLSTLRLRESAF